MTAMTIDALSGDYYHLPVVMSAGDGSVLNPTADLVAFAFLPAGIKPQAGDWKPGLWEPTGPGRWAAKILIGPAGVLLAPGDWIVWIRVTDSPTVPVSRVGFLTVT